ncbi:MAG TPA: aspartyl/asparaginyl beta-hydroxylase domain-containing protein [Streptosporangiaceae bacterium]|nr:aspartyl/asparaginyl beta-hydroxylase domain-containing protein [Streptosporangiaceae bacterium]
MTTENGDQVGFTCAMVERFLAAEGLDAGAVELVEAGMRSGRLKENKPPDPWQQPTTYYPGLTAKPWHDPASFAWVPTLEAAFEEIKDEALTLLEAGRYGPNPISGGLAEGTWEEVRLYTEGHTSAANCLAAPLTAKLVASIPGATTAGLAYLAHVAGGTHVRPHWGPHNARLRCHLGLVVPEGCSLRVGAQTGGWTEGKVIVFDDSFEHEVWNTSDRSRLVLILDIWHPDLTPAQIAAIRYGNLPIIKTAYEVAEGWQRHGTVPRLSQPAELLAAPV